MDLSSFAYGLFSLLSANPTGLNILISPFSIASALALVLAGATIDSPCQEELRRVLNVGSHLDLPLLSQQLLSSAGPSVCFTSANGIWSKDLKDSYIAIVKQSHDAAANKLPDTYESIDAYISKKTNGLIKNMLEGPIDPLTVAVVVNAVHFKGDWTTQFDKKLTTAGYFTTLNGDQKEAMFMKANRNMKVAIDLDLLQGASIVQLDYGKDDASEGEGNHVAEYVALFILPSQEGREALNGVIQCLLLLNTNGGDAESSFSAVLGQMNSHRKVKLSLPRFKLSYGTKSIKDELRSLGINSCFDGERVLMEMSSDPLVHVDEVLHKAVLEVTEEGTEAAAASVGIMMTRSLPPPPIELQFNRPFIMLILHQTTKTPLFVARVDDPELMF